MTTVDVPPGTPPDAIQLPDLSAPITEGRGRRPVDSPRRDRRTDNGGDDTADKPQTTTTRSATRSRVPRQPRASPRISRKHAKRRRSPATSAGPTDPDARQPDAHTRPPRPRSASAYRTSSSASSASRPSCFRSTRPPERSTASAGKCSRRSTRSRPTTAATSMCRPRARSVGCSSSPLPGACTEPTRTATARRIPYNPVDAIFAAAPLPEGRRRATSDLRRAIFAYNHADWYVDSVMMRARLISGLPADLVGSLTGLTQGHFPVHARPATRTTSPSATCAGSARRPAARTTPPRSSTRTTTAARSTSTRGAALR